MLEPAELEIVMVQGRMWELVIDLANDDTGDPIDVTGWEGNLQVRDLDGNLQCEAGTNANPTTGGTFEALNSPAGRVRFKIPASRMYPAVPGTHKYDLDLIPSTGSDDKQQYFRGSAEILDAQTQI